MECHPHDLQWITQQLAKLPPALRVDIAQKYSALWLETGHRQSCNLRLLNYVEAYEQRQACQPP